MKQRRKKKLTNSLFVNTRCAVEREYCLSTEFKVAVMIRRIGIKDSVNQSAMKDFAKYS